MKVVNSSAVMLRCNSLHDHSSDDPSIGLSQSSCYQSKQSEQSVLFSVVGERKAMHYYIHVQLVEHTWRKIVIRGKRS